ncbi:hypothetical protein DV495_004447 [Geotrichum candidum]|uniref:Uncharacterized protein n=1 Tax=Geotrichum candidum TaxID=1173061 RepID=A0A0J9X9Y1_GEOCN|nr:hypothetical protein DV452_002904 [Geotrichum candidum]KAI9213227.1 hypothetical protein DS838_001871 [Geotrichum bryndzae]KAF5119100.1 hypothetical protein DV454_000202 [Geotrichum candidum]KAF5120772.1 hypothetical protein DV495_004447 [Geotrichum candidum]KAF7499654.1 hypothetical protein DV113_002330 [Geotrichum candidum]
MSLSRSLTQRLSNKIHRSNSVKQQQKEEDQFVSINYDTVEEPKKQPQTLKRAASILSRSSSSKALSAVSTTTSIATTPAALASPASGRGHKHNVSVSSSGSSCYSTSMASSVQTNLDDQAFHASISALNMPLAKDETSEADAVAMKILERVDSEGELNWTL